MARRLAESLHHILEQAGDQTGLTPDERGVLDSRIESPGPFRPGDFGAYNDILAAVSQNDRELFQRSLARLCRVPDSDESLVVLTLSEAELGAARFESYRRYATADTEIPLEILVPEPGQLSDFRRRIGEAMDWYRQVCPELAEEIGEIAREIIAAPPDRSAHDTDFDGISIFEMWGAVFMNPDRLSRSTIDAAMGLAHETTHHLLFSFCTDEPMSLNEPGERHRSPLRADPRPMEGIFHATVVVARMHFAASRLLTLDGLEPELRKELEKTIDDFEIRFADGAGVIREHGRLTATGQEVLAGAEAYMAEAAA